MTPQNLSRPPARFLSRTRAGAVCEARRRRRRRRRADAGVRCETVGRVQIFANRRPNGAAQPPPLERPHRPRCDERERRSRRETATDAFLFTASARCSLAVEVGTNMRELDGSIILWTLTLRLFVDRSSHRPLHGRRFGPSSIAGSLFCRRRSQVGRDVVQVPRKARALAVNTGGLARTATAAKLHAFHTQRAVPFLQAVDKDLVARAAPLGGL
jgi:hypothetical protein